MWLLIHAEINQLFTLSLHCWKLYCDQEYKLIIISIIIFSIANLMPFRTVNITSQYEFTSNTCMRRNFGIKIKCCVKLWFLYLVGHTFQCIFINFKTKFSLITAMLVKICPQTHSDKISCQPIPDRVQREEDSLSARKSSQWRHNGRDGVSNHQHYECLPNRLLKAQMKENIKAPHQWLLWGEFTGHRWIHRTKGQ